MAHDDYDPAHDYDPAQDPYRTVAEQDPYLVGAAYVLQKALEAVTKAERQRYKEAFMRTFVRKAGALISDALVRQTERP